MTERQQNGETDAPQEYVEKELEESTDGLEFMDDPERDFGTGLLLPDEDEDFTEQVAAGAGRHMRVRRAEDLVAEDAASSGKKAWKNTREPYLLSQGRYPACTGFSGANLLNTAPILNEYRNDMGFYLYSEATKLDSVQGRFDYKTMKQYGSGGSTGEGIARALVATGHGKVFAVTSSIETAIRWCLNNGPFLLLMPFSGAFEVDENGYVHPNGERAGHAVCVRAVFRDAEGQRGPDRFVFRNSWNGWGIKGEARLAIDEIPARHTFVCIGEAA